jgi:hypothetical protein
MVPAKFVLIEIEATQHSVRASPTEAESFPVVLSLQVRTIAK